MELVQKIILHHEAIRNLSLSLAATIGFCFIGWRTLIASKQVKLTEANSVTDSYMKCIELLGSNEGESPCIERRLGAIYGLDKIASNNSDEYQYEVLKVLIGYIRLHANGNEGYREDIQAAITTALVCSSSDLI